MALNIKNAATERLARELAYRKRVGITEALHQALEQALLREHADSGPEERLRYIRQLQQRVAGSGKGDRQALDDLMYDERGLPRA